MKKYLTLVLIPGLLAVFSCEKMNKNGSPDGCSFAYNPSTTELKWTAFKFTKKVGVGGTFNTVAVQNNSQGNTVTDTINGFSFSIDTDSVNSANEERDARIRKFFFGSMKDSKTITGKLEDLDSNGNGQLAITMNGIEKEIPIHYKIVNENEVEAWGTLDLSNWKADSAIKALNQECKDLHKGEDGISKLWPDIELRVYTKLDKNCD